MSRKMYYRDTCDHLKKDVKYLHTVLDSCLVCSYLVIHSSITSCHQKRKKPWLLKYTWGWLVTWSQRENHGAIPDFTISGYEFMNQCLFSWCLIYRGKERHHNGNLYIVIWWWTSKSVCASLHPSFPQRLTHQIYC